MERSDLLKQLDLPPEQRSFSVDLPEQDDREMMEVLARVRSKIESSNKLKTRSLWVTRLAIAASIAFLLVSVGVIFLSLSDTVQEFQTLQGGLTEVTLNGDRSNVVTINASSKAAVSKFVAFKTRTQEITLEGEAYFRLNNHSVNIKVGEAHLLTDNGFFNVYHRDGRVILSSVTAFINVAFKGLTRTVGPGQQIDFFDYASVIPEAIAVTSSKIGSWVRGEFEFENQRLSFALAEFTRQFGVQLEVPEGFDPLVSARFNKRDGWEHSLKSLANAAGVTYRTGDGKIEIATKI